VIASPKIKQTAPFRAKKTIRATLEMNKNKEQGDGKTDVVDESKMTQKGIANR
jgi:hypothetical protein